MIDDDVLPRAEWRKSSFSGGGGMGGGDCVEIASLEDGRFAVRNSNHHEKGMVVVACAEMEAWIKRIKTGQFDDLA